MAGQTDVDVRQGAKAAAAAAAVGAAVGVARALAARADATARRDGDDSEPREEQHADAQDQSEAPTTEEEPRESQANGAEPETSDSADAEEPRTGTAPSGLRHLTDQARTLLEELSGAEVESVSALDRTRNGWRVRLEAVELRRIPESTDVLATYEVELDEDGDLVRYERLRRYGRAQSDREGGT